MLLDIDRLDDADTQSVLFSVDRFNLFSFHRCDHLPESATDLREWISGVLAARGIDAKPCRIQLLCMPRVLGWQFNPLSVWYCQDQRGNPVAALCEVHNTFGERHCYLLEPEVSGSRWPIQDSSDKQFHVSPFISKDGEYRFTLQQPGEQLALHIQHLKQGELLLTASQVGEQKPLTTENLIVQFFRVPMQTLKVVSAIHWQALKIWMRGARLYRKPAPPTQEVS